MLLCQKLHLQVWCVEQPGSKAASVAGATVMDNETDRRHLLVFLETMPGALECSLLSPVGDVHVCN